MIALLAAMGCAANAVTEKGGAPFSIGSIESALWWESAWSDPESGEGEAYLLMVTESLDCEEAEEFFEDGFDEDGVGWSAEGLLVNLAWYTATDRDAGWEGTYWTGYTASYSDTHVEGSSTWPPSRTRRSTASPMARSPART